MEAQEPHNTPVTPPTKAPKTKAKKRKKSRAKSIAAKKREEKKRRAKNKGGRPQYEPSESDRLTVMTLVAADFPHREIAMCIGKEGISEPTLRKHFRYELEAGKAQVNRIAVSSTVKAMSQGQSWACTLWLTRRMGWREKVAEDAPTDDGLKELADAIRNSPHSPEPNPPARVTVEVKVDGAEPA